MVGVLHVPVCCKPLRSAQRSGRCAHMRLVVRAQQQQRNHEAQAAAADRKAQISALVRPAALTALTNVLMALPAHAEAGKIFDFNLTLPVMVAEFLVLMVFLDKFWFTPVGNTLDERDKLLRDKLASVKDNSSELERLQKEAEKALAEARQQAQKVIQEAKSEAQREQDKKLAEVKERIDKELAQALAALDKEKESALSNLDKQVDTLASEILTRVLPEGIKV